MNASRVSIKSTNPFRVLHGRGAEKSTRIVEKLLSLSPLARKQMRPGSGVMLLCGPDKAGRVCPFPTLQRETQYFLWNSNPEKCLRQPRTTLNYFPSSRQLFFYSQGPEGSWKFLVINSTSCCVRLGTMKFPETDCSIAL
jgi:hypothetical protein